MGALGKACRVRRAGGSVPGSAGGSADRGGRAGSDGFGAVFAPRGCAAGAGAGATTGLARVAGGALGSDGGAEAELAAGEGDAPGRALARTDTGSLAASWLRRTRWRAAGAATRAANARAANARAAMTRAAPQCQRTRGREGLRTQLRSPFSALSASPASA